MLQPNYCDSRVLHGSAPLTVLFGISSFWDEIRHRRLSLAQAGAPAPVKGAIFYNDLLDFKKLGGKHTQIVEGDKVKWVYLKQNPYKIETLSFLDYDLPEEIEEFLLKYVDRPRAFDTILKNKLESFYEDLNWGGLNLNPTVEQFFKFI